MKNFVFLIITVALFISGCSKQSQTEIDEDLIIQYIADNNIDATKTESGLYYQITKQGDGPSPDITDIVNVHYVGELLDGTIFDETTGTAASFNVSAVILGWQEGLQLMNAGGEALFIIPSRLGYGSYTQSGIPANSVLVFSVTLQSIR